MALYLKYRPQNLDQLIGQDHIKKVLTNAFGADKLSHAYLFVGPRGTGKTSTARILAKMVNCENSTVIPSKEGIYADSGSPIGSGMTNQIPCNQCSACTSITDGSNLDLIEIDAASNRGIDDIRTLRENIKLAPAGSKKKIYIIDEVHMLTTEAFNALLKTLEEPPKHVIFILATTDVQKIPQTILSRVQRLDFKLATPDELLQALERVIEAEKIEIEPEALKLIVKLAEGSFRDGVKFLDQLFNGDGKITINDVITQLQGVEQASTFRLLELLSENDIQGSLKLISKNKNGDIKGWIVSIMGIVRALVFIKNGVGETLVAPEYSQQEYENLSSLASKFELPTLIKALDCLQNALEKLRYASIPVLPLELAVIEISQDLRLDGRDLKLDEEVRSSKLEHPVSNLKPQTSSDDAVSPDIALLQEKWNFVLETIKPYNFSLEALLRLVKILECGGGMVVLEVPYSFHQRILEAPKSRDLLESVLSDILGKTIRVSCVLATKPMRAEDIANVEVAADDEVIKAAAEIFGS